MKIKYFAFEKEKIIVFSNYNLVYFVCSLGWELLHVRYWYCLSRENGLKNYFCGSVNIVTHVISGAEPLTPLWASEFTHFFMWWSCSSICSFLFCRSSGEPTSSIQYLWLTCSGGREMVHNAFQRTTLASDYCFNPNCATCQLYDGEHNLHSMKWWWCPLCTSSLK